MEPVPPELKGNTSGDAVGPGVSASQLLHHPYPPEARSCVDQINPIRHRQYIYASLSSIPYQAFGEPYEALGNLTRKS